MTPNLVLPDIRLELVEELSPPASGFLSLVRRRYRAHYPDGSVSEPFVYDAVTRRALDAVVIAAHYRRDDAHWVYLRSAVRPPVTHREPAHSAAVERGLVSLWELPAGLVEPGEESSPEGVARAAARELAEELGYDLDPTRLEPLGPSTFPAPGFIAERHFFFHVAVDQDPRTEPELDGSALEKDGAIVAVPLEAALELCATGEIEDAKTELALRRLAERVR